MLNKLKSGIAVVYSLRIALRWLHVKCDKGLGGKYVVCKKCLDYDFFMRDKNTCFIVIYK